MTSRQVSFSDEFEAYQIGFLDTKQCMELFERIRFGGGGKKISTEEIPDLEYVIETLAGRHTITVEHLAHLARTKLWTVKKLRKGLEEKGFQLEFRKNGEPVNIQKSYEALYDLSKLTEAEQNILEAFSLFPYIPLAAETCSEWLLKDAGVSEDDDILMELYQKGWLQFDIKQESYVLHPVFAQFICEKCNPSVEKHLGLMEACQGCLKISKDGSALECQKYIPFAESIVEKVKMRKKGELSIVINEIAYISLCIAEYEKAEKWYEKLLKIQEDTQDYSNIVVVCNNLSAVYLYKEQYEKAEELVQKGLQILESKVDEDQSKILNSYRALAAVYEKQERYEEAEELYKIILNECEQMYEKDYIDIASDYNNLA
ncbi:MAG: tetratricopeptide repeat protein, partial [Lachnospiraceae bacterium]|nr:tetratricopeptide repeat protein [Lachnospiraceae bacterium]